MSSEAETGSGKPEHHEVYPTGSEKKAEYEMVSTKDVEVGVVGSGGGGNARQELTANITEHKLSKEELEIFLETDLQKGLTQAEADRRLERDGPNALTPPPKTPWWWMFFMHIAGGFAILLWIGSILCFIVYGLDGSVENLTLGIVLAVVVVMTGTFSFYQDMQAEKVLAGFSKLTPTLCDVIRDGETKRINAVEIVMGDVVFFEKGNKVPVDVIILTSNGIKVDNSSLTGESEPQKRTPQCTDAENPFVSRNVAFYGTNCTEGNGSGVAVRCGDLTAIGMIADATTKGVKPEALMVAEIDRFVKIISVIALALGITFLIVSIAVGYTVFEACIFTIGIIVANVPEGLLATVTLSLTITAQRMAEKHVLVKNTKTVETLGSVNVICSDKTGTLTQNHMIVRHAIFNSSKVVSTTQGRQFTNQSIVGKKAEKEEGDATLKPGLNSPKKGEVADKINVAGGSDWQTGIHPVSGGTTVGQRAQNNSEFDNLLNCGALCNHALFAPGEQAKAIEKRATTSDPSEGAILKFCHSYLSVYDLRAEHPEVACIPFTSAAKWMAVIVKEKVGHRVIIKGAPERVMERCSTHGKDNQELTEEIRRDIDDANREVAENGERVMAFGEMYLPDVPHGFEFDTDSEETYNFPVRGLRFVGILAMEDPPRPEVPAAVASCHEAGIKVVMVTGDHPLTARNIAGQVNIIRPAADGSNKKAQLFDCSEPPEVRRNPENKAVVVTGSELEKFEQEDWDYVLSRDDIVFARTLPQQKQTIVANFQEKNMVVAVTGDGVNDAPALKKADVGIAMGSGSQVSHDAADMILMDDNFASIVQGIEEGRLIFVNLKKSIAYTLTSNIPEIVPFLCQIILQIPNALTTIMILCIDLGTDLLPAIAFSYEVPENDIMKVPPRDREKNKLVTWQLISWSYLQIGVIQAFAAYTTYFFVFDHYGNISSNSLLVDRQGIIWLDDNDDDKDDSNCTFKDDSYKCIWFEDRRDLLRRAQTAFLASIIIMQLGCGFACKTRLSSLFTHGFENRMLSMGMLTEIILIILLVYAPFLNYTFATFPLGAPEWFVAMPFAVFLVFYDECRKYLMRTQGPSSWIYQNFYF